MESMLAQNASLFLNLTEEKYVLGLFGNMPKIPNICIRDAIVTKV